MNGTIIQIRTQNYYSQIKTALAYKGIAVIASFVAVPLMIRYLGQERFGVWATILSVMSWIMFFDLGIGNGLRNKVAETLAKDEKLEAANYISSGYSMVAVIAVYSLEFLDRVDWILNWCCPKNITDIIRSIDFKSDLFIIGAIFDKIN